MPQIAGDFDASVEVDLCMAEIMHIYNGCHKAPNRGAAFQTSDKENKLQHTNSLFSNFSTIKSLN